MRPSFRKRESEKLLKQTLRNLSFEPQRTAGYNEDRLVGVQSVSLSVFEKTDERSVDRRNGKYGDAAFS